MEAVKLRNGHLLVPFGDYDEEHKAYFDGMKEIAGYDPEYDKWVQWHNSNGIPIKTIDQFEDEQNNFGKSKKNLT